MYRSGNRCECMTDARNAISFKARYLRIERARYRMGPGIVSCPLRTYTVAKEGEPGETARIFRSRSRKKRNTRRVIRARTTSSHGTTSNVARLLPRIGELRAFYKRGCLRVIERKFFKFRPDTMEVRFKSRKYSNRRNIWSKKYCKLLTVYYY